MGTGWCLFPTMMQCAALLAYLIEIFFADVFLMHSSSFLSSLAIAQGFDRRSDH